MISTKIAVDSDPYSLTHDSSNTFKIGGKPLSYTHVTKKGTRQLQAIEMMQFQNKIQSIFRADLLGRQLSIPLNLNMVEIQIEVLSSRTVVDVPLLMIMKSILDGLNNNILRDDSVVYRCSINYTFKKRLARQSLRTPSDWLSVTIIDLSSSHVVASLNDINIHLVPKKEPLVLDFDNDYAIFNLYEDEYLDSIYNGLSTTNFAVPIQSCYEVTMKFSGALKSVDIDNLALVYYRLIEDSQYMNLNRVTSISLEKTYNSKVNHTVISIF